MGVKEFSILLTDLSRYTDIAGLMVGIFYFKKLSPLYRGLLLYLFLMFFTERLSVYILRFTPSNHIVLPIYAFLEVVFFTWFYNFRLFTKPRRLLLLLGFAGSLYIGWELVFNFILKSRDIRTFQPYCKVVDNFIVIIFALSYLHKKMTRFSETRFGNFWLNLAILVFFTFTLIIFLPFNFLVNASSDVIFYFWALNIVLVILFYSFISIRIFLHGRAVTLAERNSIPAEGKEQSLLIKVINTIVAGRAGIFKK
jgi:hypothetical protein